ncbi:MULTISPECIES: cysteine--tRNA ligase [unclassified Granulicatella]|uniref:cysteine--tRNA ligase n=1 Tax=unclassified Granulicatella TaxID=2630493 RepID=UPI00107394C8|nr:MULTISPECIES: cysteine--tRNA ligase [unclassified Granulicatella]MBF0781053.1 cysteine--tRNA ligase [Granulicatella sp. 19428wC4_WM01]TFU92431.1 cysteine--tRNA ligase [Granulicatella sp. WM01]
MKIYNTLTKQKEAFKPLKEGKVSMYVCGPTVYNYIHIGNARSAVAFDTIRRYLEYRGYDVNYVSNFTDVDDKIIHRGHELQLSPQEVAEKFIQAFYEDTTLLNIKKATLNPRVMESIEDIIQFVQDLIDKDYAYISKGDVYYRTNAFKDYGKLSGQSLDDLMSGASERVADEELSRKENPLDFALWKSAKDGEISWESPWGQGRPGWHIECSVMAIKHLGDTIDIHAGGHDLTFPHHENEIAQSEAKTGKQFANYWLHNGFVTFDGEKMSKSLGNFVVARDLLQQVDPQIVRFLLASAHYRHPLAFSESVLNEAENNLEKLRQAYRNIEYRLKKDAKEYENGQDKDILEKLNVLKEQFIAEMDDDFNVPNGLSVLYKLAKELNIYSEQPVVYREIAQNMLALFSELAEVFGIVLAESALIDEEILALIEERSQARANKDFKRSDAIRDYLKDQGIILDDTPQGTRFKRI